jgi:hypothetical protein
MADSVIDVKFWGTRKSAAVAAALFGAGHSLTAQKGAVSAYGMGRFPVTLYKEQWLKLLSMFDDIRAFTAEMKRD